MTELDRADFGLASRIEHALTAAGQPGRCQRHRGDAWGITLWQAPRRGSLGALGAALVYVFGVPVRLVRRGRQVVVRV